MKFITIMKDVLITALLAYIAGCTTGFSTAKKISRDEIIKCDKAYAACLEEEYSKKNQIKCLIEYRKCNGQYE
jgi:hypothetical protein